MAASNLSRSAKAHCATSSNSDAFRVVAFPGNEDDPTKFWNRYNVNGLSSRVSGGLYGVFKTPPAPHIDFVSTIGKTSDYIRDVWLPQSRYERRRDYEFERYVEESRLFSETIFVPVRIKNRVVSETQ